MSKAYDSIQQERRAQDAQWGGPSHDDTHMTGDWFTYILYQVDRARYPKDIDEVRERLVKIGALAVAAIDSIDRKNP